MGVPIKENTKQGYKMAYPGDSIDLGYAGMNTRRGRVGHQIAHTLTTGIQQGTLHFVDLSPPPLVTEHCRCLNTRQSGIHNHKGECSGVLKEEGARAVLTPGREETRQNGRRMKEPKHQIANGGDTRFQSSKNGLALIPDDEDGVVGIHDGVRPFGISFATVNLIIM